METESLKVNEGRFKVALNPCLHYYQLSQEASLKIYRSLKFQNKEKEGSYMSVFRVSLQPPLESKDSIAQRLTVETRRQPRQGNHD